MCLRLHKVGARDNDSHDGKSATHYTAWNKVVIALTAYLAEMLTEEDRES